MKNRRTLPRRLLKSELNHTTLHGEHSTNPTFRQAAAEKQKRQGRDTMLKKQAKSRKAEAQPVSKATAITATQVGDAPSEALQVDAVSGSSRKRKLDTPNLLPDDLLESDDEADEEEARRKEALTLAKSKKIKLDVNERVSQHAAPIAQDERVGSTVYRVVAEKGNGKLAPKVGKESWQLKEKLLARHRLPEKKKGFLVKKR